MPVEATAKGSLRTVTIEIDLLSQPPARHWHRRRNFHSCPIGRGASSVVMTSFATWLTTHDPILLVSPASLQASGSGTPVSPTRTRRTRTELLEQANNFYGDSCTNNSRSKVIVWALKWLVWLPIALYVLARRAFFFQPLRYSSTEAAQNIALWITYVPLMRLAEQGGLKGVVLPSSSPAFKARQVRCSHVHLASPFMILRVIVLL